MKPTSELEITHRSPLSETATGDDETDNQVLDPSDPVESTPDPQSVKKSRVLDFF